MKQKDADLGSEWWGAVWVLDQLLESEEEDFELQQRWENRTLKKKFF